MKKYECEVFWVFRDGSRKRVGRVAVEAYSEEYAKGKALRYLDEVSTIFPLAEPPNLLHYEAECREEEGTRW